MLDNQENEKDKEEADSESERDYGSAILSIIRGDSSDELLRELLEDYHDNDIASILDSNLCLFDNLTRKVILCNIFLESFRHLT